MKILIIISVILFIIVLILSYLLLEYMEESKKQIERITKVKDILEEQIEIDKRKIERIEFNNLVQTLSNEQIKIKYKPNIKIRVLLADYNKDTATISNVALKNMGIETFVVPSGIDVVDMIRERQDYDLIITNRIFKNFDGVKLLHKLRNNKRFDIPVIVLTVDLGKEEYYTKEVGFDGYIEKMLNEDKVKKCICNLMSDVVFEKVKR